MPPVVTLLTDFGLADPFVGIMKGVILGQVPKARLVDLTHLVPPQQILAGALQLRSAVSFFPAGTVHLAVVDPGVGSSRRALVVETPSAFLVGPDNGLLAPAAELLGVRRMFAIEARERMRQPVSSTFHGRDVFAPVAAYLAAGGAADAVGPRRESMTSLPLPVPRAESGSLLGEVIHVDGFGNLVTNLEHAQLRGFPARGLSVSIAGVRLASVSPSYSAVPEGAAVAVIGSWGFLEIAVRNGSAAAAFPAGVGTPVTVSREAEAS